MVVFVYLSEIVDLGIMILALGFIFKDYFKKPMAEGYDPLKYYSKSSSYQNFWYAVAVVAPAIILHELAHKVVALSYGFGAIFHASYTGLGIGVVLKLMNAGFIVFVPGFVSIVGNATALQSSLIAFVGPGANLLIWGLAWLLIEKKLVHRKYFAFLGMTKSINKFLFFFNLIPIPPFDGFQFFRGLIQTIF